MAELYAQDPAALDAAPQEPAAQPTPPDYTAKRSKFLANFSKLDPGAKLDDATLEGILTDDAKGDELVTYVGQLNPAFKMSRAELAEALGYKKKVQSAVGGEASGATSGNGSVVASGQPTSAPFEEVGPGPVAQPEPLPYDALAQGANTLGLPASQDEQVIPAAFVGPRPAGAYAKRDDAGTVAEGAEYLSPASVAGQLNDDEQPLPEQDTALTAFGKDLGNIPGDLVREAGDLLDTAGDFNQKYLTPKSDVAPGYEDEVGVVTDNKASDRMGAALRARGEDMKFTITDNAKQSVLDNPTNGAAWGNLIGQGFNSIAQVGAASVVGGPLAGATMGGALGVSSTKDAARQAGIPEEEAMKMAIVLAPIQGALEEMGAGFITKNKAVTSLLTKTIIGRAMAQAGGKFTEASLAKSVASILPGVVKSALAHGSGEAVTEFLQGEAEGIAKLVADKARGNDSAPAGKGRYGTNAFDALVKSPIEQAVGGLVAGGLVSTAFHGGRAPEATSPAPSPQVAQRRRAPEGTGPITADRPAARLLGKAVVVRDDAQMTQLGKIFSVVGTGENRAIIVRDTAGKLSKHAQSDVFTTSLSPTPSPALPATPRTDPGPTADPVPTPRPQAAESNSVNFTGMESASAGGNSAVAGPTLGELVPETATEAAPLTLTMSGQPVQAFRNAEGDVELQHADGQISVLDKGQNFDHPAADFLLDATPTAAQPQSLKRDSKTGKPNAIKPGDTVSVGGIELPIDSFTRNEAGEIDAVMVEGRKGSRIVDADTLDGRNALAELNAREAQESNSVKITDLKNTNSETAIPQNNPSSTPESNPLNSRDFKSAKPVPTYGTPNANREAGAFIKDGRNYTRQEPLGSRAVQGRASTATFADGVNVPVRYALIEADELQPSHTGGSQNLTHFIPEAQPKNRSAAFDQASQVAINNIATTPDVAQLTQSPTAYAGAPIVNARGEVIQGNGRGEGIRQHYRQDGKTYRAGILKEAQAVGIDPKQAAQMKNPVLVRIADVSDVKARELGNYTAADTESGGARRLDPKQAAGRMDAEARADLGRLLTPGEDSTLTETIRGRQAEVLRFLQTHKLANTTQLQTMFRSDGALTVQGLEDVTALHRQLLFADGDTNLPELFQELPAAAQNGLDRGVGYLAGMPAEKSIIPEIQNAIAGVRDFRASGASFTGWIRQPNLFAAESERTPADKYSPLELALIKLLAEEKRPTFIAKAFAQFAFATTGNPSTLFDAVPALSRAEAVQKTFNVPDENPRTRNAATTQDPARPSTADGRPTPPPASRMGGTAENAQRANQPNAANPQQPGRKQAAEQLADSPAAKRQAALDKIKERRAQQTVPGHVTEDYTQNYKLREGEPESIRESGHKALAAAERAGRKGRGQLLPTDGLDSGGLRPVSGNPANPAPLHRPAAEIIQSDISADLREKGSANFVGRVINSVQDLATLAQVMRDPRWETFKYYFVKTLPGGGEEIVGESTMSARMPGTAPAFPGIKERGEQSGVDWLKQQIAGHGADGYYCQHNHPSGYTEPSPADIAYTKFVMSKVPGFRAHIIINHKKYGVITAQGGNVQGEVEIEHSKPLPGLWDSEKWRLTPDPLLQPSKPGLFLGHLIDSAEQMAGASKALEQQPGLIYLIGRGAGSEIKAVGRMPLATLVQFGGLNDPKGRKRGEAAIRKFARETGSVHVIIAGLPKPKGRFMAYMPTPKDRAYIGVNEFHIKDLIEKGVLLDAIDITGKSIRSEMAQDPFAKKLKEDWIGPTPAPRVWEKIAAYGIPEDDLADYRTVLESYAEEGTTGTKAMAARFREDVGTAAETNLSDEALKALVREAQQNAGIVPKQKPGKQALKDRRHATRYDESTRKSFTEDQSKYQPRKVIENRADADAYIRQVGLDNAYAVALDKPEGISPAAHIEIAEAVAVAYRKLTDEATKAGNKELAAEMWQKSKDARAAKVSKLTEAGQTLAQVAGFVAEDPDSVLDHAIKEIEKQRKPKLKKAEKAGGRVADIAVKARQAAMKEALNAPAVRKARNAVTGTEAQPAQALPPINEPTGYGASNRFFTKAKAAEARAALRKLGLSTIIPPELIHLVGYHLEAGSRGFADVSRRIVREVGARYKDLLPAAYQTAREQFVAKGGKDTGFTSPADVAALVAPGAVKKGIKALGTTLDKIAREQAAGIGPKGQTLSQRFIAEAGLSPKDAATYAAALEAEFAKQVHARKSTLRARIVTMSTRVLLGRNAATAVDKLLTTLNLAVDPQSAADLLKAQLKLPNIDTATADKFVKLAEAVRNAKPGNARADAVQDLMKALGQIEHVSLFDLVQASWYASILSGPKTHILNLTANAKQLMAEGLISTLHTWAETGSLAAATGPARGAAKGQRRALTEAARIITTGYTGTQSEKFGHNNILENKTFTGIARPLNGLKYVGRALVGEDAYFNFTLRSMRSQEMALKNAYKEVGRDAAMAGEKLRGAALYEKAWASAMSTLYGLPDLVAASESQADAENLTGTARQERINKLVNQAVQTKQDEWARIAESEGLTGLDYQQRVGELQEQAQPAELVDDAKKYAEIYTFNNPFEGRMGVLGDLIGKLGDVPVGGVKAFKFIAPFTKILTNVANRAGEWAGLGFIRAVKGGTGPKEYQGGRFYREYSPEEREKAFLRSTIGAVSALALYSMAKAGTIIITGNYSGNKDKEEEQPANSLGWGNGLFTSYKGDTMEIILASIGNLLAWEAKEAKMGREPDTAKRLAVVMGMTFIYTLEMGPSRSVEDFNKNVMGAIQNPDRAGTYLAKFTVNTAKGGVPYSSAIQQVLNTARILNDADQKETASKSAWEAAYNSLVQDVPVVRDELGDAVDILGDPLKLDSNRIWGWQPQGRTTQDQRNLDWLAEHDLIPTRSRVTDDNLTVYVNGKLRPMDAKEFHQFQVVRGQTFKLALRDAMTKPSEMAGLPTPARAAILAAGAEANQSLREMGIPTAKKVVARLRKQAVAAGKQAVLDMHQPKPTPVN